MSVNINSGMARVVQEKFVEDMRELYVEEFKQFLRNAAEEAIEEAAGQVRKRLETRAEKTFSMMDNAPIINVLFTLHPGRDF